MREQKEKPFCPTCKTEMKWTEYGGYYDSFEYWACECSKGDNEIDDKATGCYV